MYYTSCSQSNFILITIIFAPNVCAHLDGLKAEDKFRIWVAILGLHVSSLHKKSTQTFLLDVLHV